MATTSTKKNARKPWHGFAIEIGPNTDLGGEGLLMYEYASSGYTPVAAVSTPNERRRSLQATSPRSPDASALGARDRWQVHHGPVVIDGRRK